MEKKEMTIEGRSPLMVHAERLANPLDPLKKEIAEYTKKRTKTDDDWATIFRLEWEGGLYHDGERPIIPGFVMKACIRSSAKLSKRGRHIQRGVQISPIGIPIEYSGPIDIKEMWDSENFRDIRSVVVPQKGRVMRCRPIFNEWRLTFTVIVNETIINMKEVLDILELAGGIEGLCENRMNEFGRFDII